MRKESWAYQFEAFAGKLVAAHKVPGFAVGLAQNGETIYEQGFGFRNAAEGLPCNPTTVFGIGSVTKSFTCVAIMQLHERGKLDVHDPVVRYLPHFRTPDPEQTRQITIHHLMTHTAGLPPLPSLYPAMLACLRNDESARELVEKLGPDAPEINTYDDLMEYMADQKYELLGAPGAHFSYSNDGYAMLGAIIEQVSGLSYEAFVVENLLRPAGMSDSTFELEELYQHPEMTMPYVTNKESGEITASPGYWQAPAMLAAGFLRSSVADMLRYMEIFRTGGLVGNERILSPESVAAMIHPHAECSPGGYYGYGLMITPQYHGVTLVEHGGAIKGCAAQVICVPEKGLTGVALSNLGGVPSMKILMGGINACLGLPLDNPRVSFPEYQCPPELLSDYAGEYRSGEGANLKIVAEEGQLVLEMEGKRFPTRPAGEHLFVAQIPDRELPITFLPGEEGAVKAIAFGFRIIGKVPA